jgi:protein-L-isoaspartate(D-aspartate) O-methyltransferase
MIEARHRLMDQIEADIRLTAVDLGVSRLDPRVAEALRRVPRERFVPVSERELAYLNRPLPIGHGQTISQPSIVAIMSQLLEVGPSHRVFELGTGSGYQAAVLAAMGVRVYSVEIVPELAQRAATTLAALGEDKVQVRTGDGWLGWPEAAPFDGILVTAATPRVPPQLIEQLAPGGRMLIPLGEARWAQNLTLFVKDASGGLRQRLLLPVRFVPVTGNMDP